MKRHRYAVRYYVRERVLTPLEEAARRWTLAGIIQGGKKGPSHVRQV